MERELRRPRRFQRSGTGVPPVRNANGVLKQSPRLAHSAYLGSRVGTRCQPQRGCVPSRPTSCGRNQMTSNDRHVRESSLNPVGVAVVLARQPNVVPQSRDNVGLWDGAPLGLINVQTSGTGVPPVRIVQPTHGRDARATTEPVLVVPRASVA